ncbi:MAG: hypothetical protein PVJ34_13800, partial [Anaerolineae bacterium]
GGRPAGPAAGEGEVWFNVQGKMAAGRQTGPEDGALSRPERERSGSTSRARWLRGGRPAPRTGP